MKQIYKLSLFLFSLITIEATAQNGSKLWNTQFQNQKIFIENKGQFQINGKTDNRSNVLFAVDNGSSKIYFTTKGVTYSFLKKWKEKEEGDEKEELEKRKSHAEMEAEEKQMKFSTDVIDMLWEGANPNTQIIAEDITPDYQSYSVPQKNAQPINITNINSYKKIIYKNVYPDIDIEYTFHPQTGIKYTLILHPGADVSKVKMKYNTQIKTNQTGDILINTRFGNITDHAPISFYADDKSIIPSKFIKTGKTISFEVGNYNHTKTLIIDPWVQTPTLAASNGVWECERDGAGNVYIIGGDTPMKLLKYNPAGILQWTYTTPWDTSTQDWLGTLATDLAGNSYVTNGSAAAMQKISTAGAMIWSVTGGIFDEYWTIAFNCDQTKLIVGGTRITGLPLPHGDGMIFDINTTNGNVNATKVVGYDRAGFLGINDIEEVRSITSSYNARYYFITLDSLGSFDQNFAACPNSSTMFNINDTYHFGYKMENYRPNNGNSGICAIKANKNFLYTQNGTTIQKRSLTTGAVIASAAIPGGASTSQLGQNQTSNSGVDIDSCGNVYVGSSNAVIKYDANLVQLSSVAVPFKVYDVAVSTAGNIIACGATGDNSVNSRTGYVQQINMGSCNPQTLVCCDANICSSPTVCVTAPAFNLSAVTPGGTWSGTGITNAALGTFNPTVAGVGVFTITYSLACGTGQIQVIVSPCTIVTLSACAESNGNITASNGTGPYTWYNSTTTTSCVAGLGFCSGPFTVAGPPVTTWTSFATGNSVTPAGAYPFWVVDALGDSLQITTFASLAPCTVCPPLTPSITAQVNVLCFGTSTGSFNASTAGGTGPYNYILMNGGTTIATFNGVAGTQSFAGLPAGTYTLSITDANNCPGTATITITQPASAVAVAITASTNPSCGSSNGSATALASGGTSPYDYVWTGSSGTLQTTNNSSTSDILNGLAAGTYTVTITDANNCVTSVTVTLTNTGGPTINTTQTNVLCFGGSTGSATATATLGASPYDYVWAGSSGTIQTTNNSVIPDVINGLSAGTYTVTVTDNNGCTSNTTVTITQPATAPAVVITSFTNAPCGSSTGSATAQASGGSSPWDYVWTGSSGTLQTTNNSTVSDVLNNLAAGTYTVTITDANGCTASTTATISNTGGATVNITNQTNVLCFGGNTGNATANATGGASPYDYVWTGSAGTLQTANNITIPNTLSNLTAGTYTVTVTDANGCLSSAVFTITQPASALSLTLVNSINASCGASNGSALVSATGGTIGTGYTYSWAPSGGTNASASALAANTYTVTATDGNGCITTLNVVISNSTGPTVNISSQTNVNCNGASTGSATATASGTGVLTYSWSGGGGAGATASNLAAGTYTVTVTDGAGCTNTATVTITQANAIVVSTTSTASNCAVNSGTASASAVGGTGSSYMYSWNPTGGTTSTISNLAPGTYTVTVTDSLGCTQTATITVASTGGPTANAGVDVTITSGNSTVLNGTGTLGSTFSWSPADSLSCTTCPNPVATPTVTIVYTLTVTNNGCSTTDTVTVFVEILCGELYVPTAFSPNGDNQNDILFVLGDCITDLEFAIFDRWGEKVFETTDQTQGWDGIYNGKKMDTGVFAYYLNATVKGEAVSKHGNITLVK